MLNKWIQLELQSSNSATMHVQVPAELGREQYKQQNISPL